MEGVMKVRTAMTGRAGRMAALMGAAWVREKTEKWAQ
jgi:hypothetical protein